MRSALTFNKRIWGSGCIALVWLINGLYSKVLTLTPRHERIVSEILGAEYAHGMTFIIGVLEILMAIWIGSGIMSRICASMQIAIVLAMNLIECYLVPDLLLWGRFNLLFAFLFAGLIYWNAFRANVNDTKVLENVPGA